MVLQFRLAYPPRAGGGNDGKRKMRRGLRRRRRRRSSRNSRNWVKNDPDAKDLDGLSTVTGAAAPPGASTHGPAAEAFLEGTEYDAETEDAAEASETAAAATAARVRPPRPADWGTLTIDQRKNWKKQGGKPC